MIIFGTAITEVEPYDRYAKPGIDRVAEPDSKIYAHQTTGSLFRNYNLMLDLAREEPEMEALVLIHQDAELIDPDFCSKVREVLSDPEVAIVGCVGAIGVRSIAWWEGAVTWASFTHRYREIGGGDFEAMTFNSSERPSFTQLGEVDSIDGFIMVLSPWAVRELRFDESLGKLHGYDFDLCCQARAAGKKVMTADFRAIHHHSLDLISEPEAWTSAYVRLAEKWDGKLPHLQDGAADWQARARRAEAEAACAMGIAQSNELKYQAATRLLERVEKSPSWRLTKPLRAAKRLFRGRKAELS
jgi:GT2 family glycosyltransferase